MLQVEQIFHKATSTFTYILYDDSAKKAAIIDSVKGETAHYLAFLEAHALELLLIFETHLHADHSTDAARLRSITGARIGVCANAGLTCNDVNLNNGDIFFIGEYRLSVMETFGHTDTCLSYFSDGMVFTGDALLIGGTGRTDFQSGDASALYLSIQRLYSELAESVIVYPGHDYHGNTSSTIGEQRQVNSRITEHTKKFDFIETMNTLNLATPKRIKQSLAENVLCGGE